MNENKILIAKIIKAQGIKGELKIISYAQKNDNIIKYKEFIDDLNNQYKLKNLLTRNNSVYLKFEGYDNRNQAESLVGSNLYILREKLDKLQDEEFYHYQLIGLNALNNSNSYLGKVSSIYNFGAGDVIEIVKKDKSSIYIPFDKDFVGEINIKKKYIITSLPEEI